MLLDEKQNYLQKKSAQNVKYLSNVNFFIVKNLYSCCFNQKFTRNLQVLYKQLNKKG